VRADPWFSASFWRVVLYWDHERVGRYGRSRARATVVQSPSGTAADEYAVPVTGDTA
jgi:hypothetical protein